MQSKCQRSALARPMPPLPIAKKPPIRVAFLFRQRRPLYLAEAGCPSLHRGPFPAVGKKGRPPPVSLAHKVPQGLSGIPRMISPPDGHLHPVLDKLLQHFTHQSGAEVKKIRRGLPSRWRACDTPPQLPSPQSRPGRTAGHRWPPVPLPERRWTHRQRSYIAPFISLLSVCALPAAGHFANRNHR